MTTTRPSLLSPIEASRQLGISEYTLRLWRCRGKGPKYIKFGTAKQSAVAYYEEDVIAWLAERRYGSTTEHSEAVRAAGIDAGRYRTVPNLPITPPWLQSQAEQSVA